MNPPPNPHDGRKNAHQGSQDQRKKEGDFDSGLHKGGLVGKFFNKAGVPAFLFSSGCMNNLPLSEALEAFNKHVAAHETEHDHVGNVDEKIGIARSAEYFDNLYPNGAAANPSHQKKEAHFEIHISQPVMRQGSGRGRADDLVGIGRSSHRGRNSKHDQKRRHQKAAANPKDAGEKADGYSHGKDEQDVNAVTRNWQIQMWHFRLLISLERNPLDVRSRCRRRSSVLFHPKCR